LPVQALVRLAVVVCTLTLASGCGSALDDRSEPLRLRIGFGGGQSSRSEGLSSLIQKLSLDPLLITAWDGRTVAGLADEWTWSEDRKSLQLHIRKGVSFHNGQPLTSSAVAASLKHYKAQLDAYIAAQTPGLTLGGFEHLQDIETPDVSTVVLRLKQPDQFVLGQLSDVPIQDPPGSSVGTGAFKLVSQEPFVQFRKNDSYYQGMPGIDQVDLQTYDSQRRAWAAMMRGEVEMLQSVAGESVEFLEGVSDVQVHASIRAFYLLVRFNLRHPVLGNAEVRRALTQAIDRARVLQDGLRGHGRVANDPVWPFHWANNNSSSPYGYSPEAARGRLDALGLKVKPSTAPDRMPSRFRFTCIFYSEAPQFERIALLVQRNLSDVGVDMVLEPVKQRELTERLVRGDFDAYLFQTNAGRSFDRLYGFWHSSRLDPKAADYGGADQILDRLRVADAETDIRQTVADLQVRLQQDAPAVFLAWTEIVRAVGKRYAIEVGEDRDVFANLWRWHSAQPTLARR
jgi:ABC-type transport system substrate-binding protein